LLKFRQRSNTKLKREEERETSLLLFDTRQIGAGD
jgi:hypothetical protein